MDVGDIDRRAVEEALDEICSATPFRSSNQCQTLLRYIVKNSLTGPTDLLKERVIGMEVFGRLPDYDCGNDPIVRTRVAEVRKRLAQYYQQTSEENLVRIVIPSGSYRATFDQFSVRLNPAPPAPVRGETIALANESVPNVEPIVEPLRAVQRQSMVLLWTLAACLLSLFALTGFFWKRHHEQLSEDAFHIFWEPLVSSHSAAVVYLGTNHALHFSPEFVTRYSTEKGVPADSVDSWTVLPPNEKVLGSELIPNKELIGLNDVAATSQIVGALAQLHKPVKIRWGNDLGVSDLQDVPAIFIGGYSNPRAINTTKNLRFTLIAGDKIVDQKGERDPWQSRYSADGHAIDDYAIISRVMNSETGNFVVSIVGIATYSNQGAADFLSDPAKMDSVLKGAPSGWGQRNLQMILHTRAVEEIPVSTTVETVVYW